MISKFKEEYEFLSNSSESEIEYKGITYPTMEHFYQAMKILRQADRKKISLLDSVDEVKESGKKFSVRKDWFEVRDVVMYAGLKQKFSKEPFRSKILETGGEYLINGNRVHETYWGVCTCRKCRGIGENMLGRLLMKVRDEIEEEIREEARKEFRKEPKEKAWSEFEEGVRD